MFFGGWYFLMAGDGFGGVKNTYGCFQKSCYPQIIHFNRVFHYKPSIFWGTPIFGSTHIYKKPCNIVFCWGFSQNETLKTPSKVKDPLAQMRERLEAQRANAGNAPKYQAFPVFGC